MNKMRQWSLLTAVAVLVVFAAGWFLTISPQRHKAASLRSQATAQQSANATLQTQVAQLEQEKKGLPAQQALLAKYASQIPNNPELPALIRQLSSAADGAGVNLVSLAPSPPTAVAAVAQASATTATSATSTAAAPAAALDSIQVSINVKGSYYNVESFFAAVEKLTRATMITQWALTPTNTGGSASATATSSTSGSSGSTSTADADPPGTINATITALVYESPQVSPAAPAAAPAN